MEPLVLVAVLGASACHATWNALVKAGGDPLARLVVLNFSGTVFGLCLVPVVGLPAEASWPFLAASVVVHQAYFAFLMLGYRSGELSKVYPIARGSAPLLVALGAYVFAGEVLAPAQLAAVAVVCAGIIALALERARPGDEPRSVAFALLTGLTIAAYTVIDGMGGRLAVNVTAYIVWLFVIEGVLFCVLALPWMRGPAFASSLRRAARGGAAGGVLAALAYGLVIWAMSRANMTLVSALRETSVILAAIIGSVALGERLGRRRVVAASLVAAGVVWLQLARGV